MNGALMFQLDDLNHKAVCEFHLQNSSFIIKYLIHNDIVAK